MIFKALIDVMSFWTFKTTSVLLCPATHRLSVRHRTPRGRETAPRPPHMAALSVIDQRSGAAVQLGRREAWKSQYDTATDCMNVLMYCCVC